MTLFCKTHRSRGISFPEARVAAAQEKKTPGDPKSTPTPTPGVGRTLYMFSSLTKNYPEKRRKGPDHSLGFQARGEGLPLAGDELALRREQTLGEEASPGPGG